MENLITAATSLTGLLLKGYSIPGIGLDNDDMLDKIENM